MMTAHAIFLLSVLHLLIYEISSLRDVQILIPLAVRRGDSAVLRCQYDLEADALYSLKWYKGKREFYRFTPKESPSAKVFPFAGLQVDVRRSNASELTLLQVDMGVSGKFSCEVSADAPFFHTALVTGELIVVEIPNASPLITGLRHRYSVGDTLEANCTSRGSTPPANLTWFINEEMVHKRYVTLYATVGPDNVTRSRVTVLVNSDHFRDGTLKLRCTASLYTVYWQSTERSAEEEKPFKISYVVGTKEDSVGASQTATAAAMKRFVPRVIILFVTLLVMCFR